MRAFEASQICEISAILGGVYELASRDWHEPLPPYYVDKGSEAVASCVSFCETYDLKASAATLKKLTKVFEQKPQPDSSDVESLLEELRGRLSDELALQCVLILDSHEASLYRGDSGLPAKVISAFPSTRTDFGEASKCLALGRGTAAVFHCMRVLEMGLRAIATTLKDEDIDPSRNPSWQTILHKFDKELAKPLKERADEWKLDDAFYSGVAASLHAIKDAWRNPTMHPAAIYTEEQARDIWQLTHGFMRHLANKFPEGVVPDSV